MKTRIAMVLAVLFVIGFVVSIEAEEVKTSSELSISSAPATVSLNCAKEGCPKRAECDKADKIGCDKAKAGCDKAKAKTGCPKRAKAGCSKGK